LQVVLLAVCWVQQQVALQEQLLVALLPLSVALRVLLLI
jgi:hypothetical protein